MIAPAVVLRTLRHLRFRQIRYQIRNRLAPPRHPAPLPLVWRALRSRSGREKNTRRAGFEGRDVFRFNNEARRFTGDWNEAGARKLWLYNLHYMGWIFDLPTGREAWIRRWIRENPTEAGGNGWEPYPLSLRLFNWCKHYATSGTVPCREVLASMGAQAAWLLKRLEFHLDGNHLLENLLALCAIGFHFDSSDPRCLRALRYIQGHLEEELATQFLPDGGHYELSPMYHAILMERLLDLLDAWPADGDPFHGMRNRLSAVASAGLDWLEAMSVNGSFSLFNDSAYDAAPESGLLLEFGRQVVGWRPPKRGPLHVLQASGYYRADADPFTLVFDGGKLGPDHQMGHAQGDMLSFCLWLRGQPVVAHPGNYEYLPGPMRNYCRSTASHNTLSLEGAEQAEWWASHRVGWRGRPLDVSARLEGGRILLAGAHNGFSRLPGNPIHRRRIALGSDALEIQDSLLPTPGRECRVKFHFHPDCRVEEKERGILIRSAAGVLAMESDQGLRLEEGWHCPEFGVRHHISVAVAGFSGENCITKIRLADRGD